MKCPKCNIGISEQEIKDDCVSCLGMDLKGWTVLEIAEMWQARAEKAESELKAIKDRIKEGKINYIINTHLEKYNFNMNAFNPEPFKELVSTLIKQIGGE